MRNLVTLFTILLITGCASTKTTSRQRLVHDRLPRPAHIWVFDFASTASQIPTDSSLAGQVVVNMPQSAEQLALGRELGAGIAEQLSQRIRDMGLPASQASGATTMQVNDIVIRGYLISVEEGSAGKRMAIGFGSGSSELQTGVEGFQVTAQGLRKLGSAVVTAEGNKMPGAGLGAASWIVTGSPAGLIVSGGMKVYGEASGSSKVQGRAKQTAADIAKQLKKRFEEEGWID